MLKILAGLLITLFLLFVAADYVARNQAEGRAGEQLAASLELRDEPDVSLDGWPFLLKALRGRLPSASFSAEAVRSNGVTLDEVEVDVTDLRFRLEDVLSGSQEAIKISGGDGTAVLSGDELRKVLRREGVSAVVQLSGGGVSVQGRRLPKELEGDIYIDSGNLIITAGGSTIGSIRLPQIVHGLVYGDVTVEDDKAILAFHLEAATLTAP